MDLSTKSQEGLTYMIEEIKTKMQVINAQMIDPEAYDLSAYDDIHEIYQMVTRKQNLSVGEMQAILSELGQLRKSE
ncbi:DUF1128 domain-containing protein [Pseudalkalibacillus caeni]|uniref:UPF0435 protein FCL54_09270 n=1 Tax=Exobacillus caeni TaxID=2574798 RepID=A0A5R9F4R0_9BACL|nr:DUF1128 domain-containing protein [Pseudalkalibacillus caeni]TLS37336.1 DUF1128 domain-containing protein [Pseudalkalibacillus caeni]